MPWQNPSVMKPSRELVAAVLARREPVSRVCLRFKVSRQTAYKFLARFIAEGRAGLRDRSHAPKRPQSGQAPRWQARVRQLRRQRPTWGARKLRWELGRQFGGRDLPAARTLSRWLSAAGLIRRAKPTSLTWGSRNYPSAFSFQPPAFPDVPFHHDPDASGQRAQR